MGALLLCVAGMGPVCARQIARLVVVRGVARMRRSDLGGRVGMRGSQGHGALVRLPGGGAPGSKPVVTPRATPAEHPVPPRHQRRRHATLSAGLRA